MMLASLLLSNTALAAPPIRNGGNVGFGVGGGTMVSGLDMKYWFNPETSFQATAGWYDLGRGFDDIVIGLDVDFLLEIPPITRSEDLDIGFAIGVGGIGASGGGVDLVGANVIAALTFNIDAVPFDISLDYRPTVFFIDEIEGIDEDFRLDLAEFGGHIRYWF